MGLFSGIKKALNKAGDFLVKSVDVIQTGLDILGFVPVVGAVADAINAGIYVARGDYKNAALSALSAVPGIGDAAGALKLSAKAAKLAKNATKAAKIAEKGIYLNDMKNDLLKGDLLSLGMRILGPAATKGIARVGAKAVKKIGNKVSGKFGNGKIKNPFAKFKKGNKVECTDGIHCFTEETLVFTESGYIPIREVPVGSLVYSMNEQDGEIGLKEVEKVSRSSAHIIYSIQINGDVEINTTAYHQFYLDGEGWVSAINLKVADRLLTRDGIALVTSIKKIRHEERVPVFNFRIKDWVSYFVSKVRVYVHNTKCRQDKSKTKAHDIVNYDDKTPGLENHHGVLDVWANKNIPGYKSRAGKSTTIAMTPEQHAATKSVYRDWLFEKTGKKVGGKVDWTGVSAKEMQSLTEKMFDAANVSASARTKYYNAFNKYIYNLD